MRNFKRAMVPALAFAGAYSLRPGLPPRRDASAKAAGAPAARATRPTFQAWEAVLQATSWGSWAQFMGSGMKIGSAPGYRVSNMRTSCKPGGMLGTECVITANLCN